MDGGSMLRLVLIDFGVLVAAAIAIGASAPHWPDRWLQRDVGPLRLTRWDTVRRYRRIGIPWFARWLPEGGSWFGGEGKSKSHLPGIDPDSLRAYLVEVRRGEWVHFASAFTFIPLFLWNPPWLMLIWFLVVGVGNTVFFLVLRYNQLRITNLLARMQR